MDNLGGKCASEDCTQVLDIQSGNDAIACTKAQQAEEDVGSSNCTRPLPNTYLKQTAYHDRRAQDTSGWYVNHVDAQKPW